MQRRPLDAGRVALSILVGLLLLAQLIVPGSCVCAFPFVVLAASLLETQHDPFWKSLGPLPLQGRWLCYFVCVLALLPVLVPISLLFLLLAGAVRLP